jgi:hypothetical protein
VLSSGVRARPKTIYQPLCGMQFMTGTAIRAWCEGMGSRPGEAPSLRRRGLGEVSHASHITRKKPCYFTACKALRNEVRYGQLVHFHTTYWVIGKVPAQAVTRPKAPSEGL